MKQTVIFILFVFVTKSLPAANNEGNYLSELDDAIRNSMQFTNQKEDEIASLKKILENSANAEEKYNNTMSLYYAYQYYSLDSALVYIRSGIEQAEEMSIDERIIDSYLSLGFFYSFSGMYKEAGDILHKYDVSGCSPWLRRSHFYLTMTLYKYLAEYTLDKQLANDYRKLEQTARDSISNYAPEDLILRAENMALRGDYAAAINALKQDLPDGLTTRDAGLRYYILAEIYEKQNNPVLQKKYLTQAAIADIANAVREYIALRKLAIMLFEEGDIERAYRYIHKCVEDANACNARFRTIEISQALPVIDAAYKEKEYQQTNKIKRSFIITGILSVLLLVSLAFAFRQVKVLRAARKKQKEINAELERVNKEQFRLNQNLKQLNAELSQSNKEQLLLNNKLTETNKIKEEYVTRFMNLCSDYLTKMENYRKELNRIAAKRNFDALYDAVKSTRFITQEINEFYLNFDDAFLHLFPDFVKDFNKLLLPGEEIYLKEDERLNTELRIYALSRLGISDPVCVADFLRCSSSTVYNYRTRMRNKARNREDFERNVMQIR